jgi:histidinol-phosphate aminotransferase
LLSGEQNSTKISDNLLRKGMIVRNLASYGMNAIRVTIGTTEQNDRFFELMRQAIN